MWHTIVPSRVLVLSSQSLKLGSKAEQHINSRCCKNAVRNFTKTNIQKKVDYEQRAKDLHEKGVGNEEDFSNGPNNTIKQVQELQGRTPWHREGSDTPPVKWMRKSSVMTKGLFNC
jgi:hypothetical protein